MRIFLLRKNISLILILFILSVSTSSVARDIPPPLRILLKIEKRFQEISTIKGEFVKYMIKDGKEIELNGELYYKSPDKIRFKYLSPVTYDMSSDGKYVYYHNGDEKIKKELSSLSEAELAAYGLSPGFGIDYIAPIKPDPYTFIIKDDEGSATIISAIPKKEGVPRMEFSVDKKMNALTYIKYYSEENKTLNQINFLDFKEVVDDFWFAMNVTITVKAGFDMEDVEYKNMQFNTNLDDALFVQ